MLELATPRVVRYYLGQAQYRSVLDYQPTSLQEAGAAVERIDGFLSRAIRALSDGGSYSVASDGAVPEAFVRAMDDDLNVPQALAVVHETVRSGNTALTEGRLDAARQALHEVHAMLGVLGLNDTAAPAADEHADAALGVLVEAQLAARARARADKDWAASDAIRDTLAAAGVVVEDGTAGATWSLKRG
jgi:cysteinyl-tRNA synthetase